VGVRRPEPPEDPPRSPRRGAEARRLPIDPVDPSRDERLEPLLNAIERGEVDALSLDFFDTTCGRAVSRPVTAFRRVGERLAERGLLAPAIDPAAFVAVRTAAEVRARDRRPGCTEVHLRDVYAEIPAALIARGRGAEAAAIEFDVECELAILDPSVVAVAKLARSRGLRVAIASDTYFSADELCELLRRADCDFVPDLVLTSGDAGVCKSGGLLRELAARLGIAPGRIAHLGDNPAADVLAAAAAGLRGFAHPAGDAELDSVLSRETALTLENAGVDGGLAFLRRRACSRAVHAGGRRARHFRLGATVFGPVFTAFAEWIVDRLVERRVAGALCFMREGEFLAELVAGAARARGVQLDLTPLWISRVAAFRAAIGELDAATLRAALVRREPPRVDDFCRGFGIDPAVARLPRSVWHAAMDTGRVTNKVLSALLEPAARAHIERDARAQRDMLVECALAGAPPRGPIVCVDLGWGATIQRHFVSALRLAGVEREVLGLYLAASPRASAAMMEGSAVRGFLASPGEHDALAELVARSPEVLEQLCTSHVGSTLAYERDAAGRVVPTLGSLPGDLAGARDRAAVREGIHFFQAQYHALRRPSHGALDTGEVRRIVARFLARPLESEAALVGSWWHDENFGSGSSLAIAPRVSTAAVGRRSGAELYWDRSLPWPAGVAAQGHPALADELAAYALLGAFGSGESPVRHSERPAARYLVADEIDAAARAFAPVAYRGWAWALSRWAEGRETPPLRHRFVDALNDRLKRLAPSIHARAKAAAVDAIGTRGGVLWPAARRIAVWPEGPRTRRRRRGRARTRPRRG
jgi:FMN phosphatase YigB (HAD superfamily)